MDLWVRIPRFPIELLNFQTIDYLLSSNNVGTLVRLDSRSLLRNKIRFARACVRVNICEPMLEYAEITRVGGKTCGYIVWYEDFSSGCSFCGAESHEIDKCSLLIAPQREVRICLLKNPKQQCLVDALTKAHKQANAGT